MPRSEPTRRTHRVAELQRPPARVVVAGRLLTRQGTAARLADETGELEVRARAADPGVPGDIVAAAGVYTGARLERARLRVLTPYRGAGPFPPPGGDFYRLQRDGALRARRLRERAAVLATLREYFAAQGFLEVETPARVRAPGQEPHLAAVPSADAFLATSPEYQMKRLLACGFERICQIGRCFRAEEAGPLHAGEFTMAEWYRAHEDAEAILSDLEQVVAGAARRLHGGERVPTPDGPLAVAPPFERLTVREAFRRFADADADALDDDAFFRTLVDRVEPAIGRERPTFLLEWPARHGALARLKPDDPTVALRFELYAGGLELANGFDELTDPDEQRERLVADDRARKARGRPRYPLDERFLAALAEGLPPCAGVALGVDRLVLLVTGARDLREVQAFAWDEL